MSNLVLSKNALAGAAIGQYLFVKHGTADDVMLQAAAGTDLIIGSSQDVSPAQGERFDVAVCGIGFITAGAAIPRGSRLMSDANGRAIVAAAAAGSNVFTGGVAMEAATAAGDVIRYNIVPGTFQG
ncbi:capsid cement protein [uncultured Aquitalea sp.]|uniref:capsid cement protein n=1 Tax=uncultured Aquitalea sp. TaxID=540272 RepID=UPI0025D8663A|nr:capsid cement protein [uncultured Aquitalea sp.]